MGVPLKVIMPSRVIELTFSRLECLRLWITCVILKAELTPSQREYAAQIASGE